MGLLSLYKVPVLKLIIGPIFGPFCVILNHYKSILLNTLDLSHYFKPTYAIILPIL